VAVALPKTLLVSLNNLLAVVREFQNPNVSRSGLIFACEGRVWDVFVIFRPRMKALSTVASRRMSPDTHKLT